MTTRRNFIATSLAASTGALSSCVTPDRITRFPVPATERLVIDSHCHIFNAKDIDTYGYATQGILHPEWEQLLFRPLTIVLESLMSSLRAVAPGMVRENWLLDALQGEIDKKPEVYYGPDHRGLDRLALKRLLYSINPHGGDTIKQVKAARQEAKTKIDGCMSSPELNIGKEPAFDPFRKTALFLSRLLQGGFVDCMANYRVHNAIHLLTRYPDVDLFVAATLDYDTWFKRWAPKWASSEELIQQAVIMEKISRITNGRVLHRTGYCPLRQVLFEKTEQYRGSKSAEMSPLDVLRCSVEHLGSVGAKIYPVLGFRPMGNAGPNSMNGLPANIKALRNKDFPAPALEKIREVWPALRGNDNGTELGQALDKALDEFYAYCESAGASVMAHTIPAHGFSDETEERAAPNFWRAVLFKHKKLKLDLGHFGNFSGASDKENRWSEDMAKILNEQDFSNAYADLSCLDPEDPKMLAGSLTDYFHRFPHTKKRLMYGTDWHENLWWKGAHHYLDGWTKMFNDDTRLAPYAADFFGWNAVEFLGLQPGGNLRPKLEKLFAENRFGRGSSTKSESLVPSKPRWEKKLDSQISFSSRRNRS